MNNMFTIFKRIFSYKWNSNFIKTIFQNLGMETLMDQSFEKIDKGSLLVSNSYFVKLCCSVIIIIFSNNLLKMSDFSLLFNVIKEQFFFPILYLLMVIVPNFIIYETKKNRYVKRYPRLYSRMLILVLISLVEVIASAIYFISSIENMTVILITCLVGLIANFFTFFGYLSIVVGIIDFCIFTNRKNLNKTNAKDTEMGDYIDYL